MFRVWLGASSAISVCFVLMLSGALYWISVNVAENVATYRRATLAYERYERLAHEAYRYFKTEIERLTNEDFQADRPENSNLESLMEALEQLRNDTITESDAATNFRGELERVAKIRIFLNGSVYTFHEVAAENKAKRFAAAREALSRYSRDEIDQVFQPLLEGALKEHREASHRAQTAVQNLLERSRWIAIFAGLIFTCISLYLAIFLSRRLGRNIQALMDGTSRIARDQLEARIQLEGNDEFTILGRYFNQMAEELQGQQNRLLEQRDSLESRVEARTQELLDLNQNLRRMDHDRREFLADVSHELRTPITVIRGEAEILLRNRETSNEEYRSAMQRIVELAVQVGDHVQDLLTAARSEQTQTDRRTEPVDLRDLMTDVSHDLSILAAETDLGLRIELPDRPTWILADFNRLRQALLILGDNACRYSHANGQIDLTLKQIGNRAEIRVKDDGIGIEPTDIERIFDRRFRGKTAAAMRPDGLGLGLAMVKIIIEQHGGTIRVLSEPAHGSLFLIELPLIAVPDSGEKTDIENHESV